MADSAPPIPQDLEHQDQMLYRLLRLQEQAVSPIIRIFRRQEKMLRRETETLNER